VPVLKSGFPWEKWAAICSCVDRELPRRREVLAWTVTARNYQENYVDLRKDQILNAFPN
jgi:hypothetical protein